MFRTIRGPLFFKQITGRELIFGRTVFLRDSSDCSAGLMTSLQNFIAFFILKFWMWKMMSIFFWICTLAACYIRRRSLKRIKNLAIGTIHFWIKRRRQIFTIFDLYPPPSAFFTTLHRRIWQIFNPLPPKKCQRLKWIVPYCHAKVVLVMIELLSTLKLFSFSFSYPLAIFWSNQHQIVLYIYLY